MLPLLEYNIAIIVCWVFNTWRIFSCLGGHTDLMIICERSDLQVVIECTSWSKRGTSIICILIVLWVIYLVRLRWRWWGWNVIGWLLWEVVVIWICSEFVLLLLRVLLLLLLLLLRLNYAVSVKSKHLLILSTCRSYTCSCGCFSLWKSRRRVILHNNWSLLRYIWDA